ncbi:hypothetical protein ACS0TY_029218 [Phlomoides rotata]
MERLNFASSEHQLVKIVCSIVIKGHWDKLLKPKIGSVVTSSVLNQALLNLSPHGFSLSWSFFKWVETISQYKPSLQSSWTMICILTEQRHFRNAQNLLEKIARKDFLSSPAVLNALVNSCCFDPDVNSHVLSWLVIFYANSKMNPDALQVFDHMRVCGYKPHLHACTVLLNSLVKERLTDTVWKVYKKMTKLGVIPNIHVYNVLIHACCKSRDVEKAEELLSQMESISIFPDIFTYNTLISLYCKKGMHYEALSVQERMKRGGVCPDIVTYNSLIYSYCREGRMREALRLLKEIKDASPNHVTYTTLIDGYCRVGDLDEALKLLDIMEAKQLYPGVVTYNALLRKLCEEGRLQDSHKILNEMSERKVEPDVVTCNTLINAYCKIGDMGSALRFKSKMMEGGLRPDQYTYKALIQGYCKAREVNRAKETLFDMLRAGFSPSYCIYMWLVDCYNNDEDIVMLIGELEQGGLCVDISAYRGIIRRLCKKDRIECAERVYKIMGARGILGDSIVYVSLAYVYFRAGEAVAVSGLLDEMYKRRLVVTLGIFRSISASYSNDGSKLDVFWDTLTERGLISKPIYAQIQQMKL